MATERAVEIGTGVLRIPTLPGDRLNAYLVLGDGTATLVDCGLRWRCPATILRTLDHLGVPPSAVTRIISTHAHLDHVGGLAQLKRGTHARSAAHSMDAPCIEAGRTPSFDRSTRLGRWADLLIRFGFPRANIDECLVDGQILPDSDLEVIHTPGHTPGHICLLHRASQVLLVGDALYNFKGRISWPAYATCSDFAMARHSATRLTDLDYAVAGFGHGPELDRDARALIREFVRA